MNTPIPLHAYKAQGLRRLANGIEVDGYDTPTVTLSQSLGEGTSAIQSTGRRKQAIDSNNLSDILITRGIEEYDRDLPAVERLKDGLRDFQSTFYLNHEQHAILQSFAKYLALPLNATLEGTPLTKREEENVRTGIIISCDEFLTDIPKYISQFSDMFFQQYSHHMARIKALPAFLNHMIGFLKAVRVLPEYSKAINGALNIIRGKLRSRMTPAASMLSDAHLGDFNRDCLFAFDIYIDAPQYGKLRYIDDIDRALLLQEDKALEFGPIAKDQVYSELRTKSVDEIPNLVNDAAMNTLGHTVPYNPRNRSNQLPDEVLLELRRMFKNNTQTHKLNIAGVEDLNRCTQDDRDVRYIYALTRIEKSVRQISKIEKYSDELWLVHLDALERYKSDLKEMEYTDHCANTQKHAHTDPIVSIWDDAFIQLAGGVDALIGIKLKAFFHQVAATVDNPPQTLPTQWWITNLVDIVTK